MLFVLFWLTLADTLLPSGHKPFLPPFFSGFKKGTPIYTYTSTFKGYLTILSGSNTQKWRKKLPKVVF